jgi:hypothetical protein
LVPLRTRLELLALALLGLASACGGSVADPDSARCNDSKPTGSSRG